jgi:hypothetical protein
MGLDIYVRWGEYSPDDGWVGFPEEASQNQMTGFVSAPYAGYLRESWGSLSWVARTAKELGGPNPYDLFADWSGSNGENMPVDTPERVQVALAFRAKLLEYLRGEWSEKQDALYKNLRDLYDVGPGMSNEKQSEWAQAHSKLEGTLRAYLERITDMIGFINFIECNKDKQNLTVCYY